MGFFRRAAPDAAPWSAPAPLDLARFERLVETSLRLRDAGVDFHAIELRASADAVSFDEALEAMDAELHA